MPVFAVSESFGKAVAKSSGAAYYPLTHQHGHIGAALLEHGLQGEFLALHVSGGTTDLLLVTAENGVIREIRPLGGTLDIAAGQLVDRGGTSPGSAFPLRARAFCSGGAGPAAGHCLLCPWARSELFRRGNCGKAHDRRGMLKEDVAASTLKCVGKTLEKLIKTLECKRGLKKSSAVWRRDEQHIPAQPAGWAAGDALFCGNTVCVGQRLRPCDAGEKSLFGGREMIWQLS